MQKTIVPSLNTLAKYELKFSNALYNPHSGHNSAMGGITSSTGFTLAGETGEHFLDDDGAGNLEHIILLVEQPDLILTHLLVLLIMQQDC